MGVMSPSKMPKAKTITRKDDPNKVTMYAKGGKVRKFGGGGGVDDTINNSFTGNLRKNLPPLSPGTRRKAGEVLKWMEDHPLPSLSELPGKAYSAAKGLNKELLGTKPAYKQGGTSKVNAAGNYTKPGMRKSLFGSIKSGGKGGAPGQWSARKAQMLALQYKKKGGGYK